MEVKEAADLMDNLVGMVEDSHGADYDTALRMGIEALSVQPERILYANMPDAEFERWLYEHGICNPNIHESIPCDAVPLLIDNAISELPSSQPPIEERKTGKWVGVKEYCDHLNEEAEREGKGKRYMPTGLNIYVYCNQCWKPNDRRTTYCPNCGARMEGEEHG